MLVSFKELADSVHSEFDYGEVAAENEWLFHEIMSSLPAEVIEQANQRREFNVLLSIDNIIVEPQLLNEILTNIDKYISDLAEKKVHDKLRELENRFQVIFGPLEEATKSATEKIREEFNLKTEENDRSTIDAADADSDPSSTGS